METKRLRLRAITMDDIEDIYAYSKDEKVGPDAGWKPHESLEETEEIAMEVFYQKKDIFGIIEKESGRLIGTIGLTQDTNRENEDVHMLGYAMGRAYWGKGYMTEAAEVVLAYGFEQENYPMISVTHYDFNIASRRVIEKLGFHYDGTLRWGAKRYDGEIFDVCCYSLLQEEYQKNKMACHSE